MNFLRCFLSYLRLLKLKMSLYFILYLLRIVVLLRRRHIIMPLLPYRQLIHFFQFCHRVLTQILPRQFLIQPILLKVTISKKHHRTRTNHSCIFRNFAAQVPRHREAEKNKTQPKSVNHARSVIFDLILVIGDEGGVSFESRSGQGDTFTG